MHTKAEVGITGCGWGYALGYFLARHDDFLKHCCHFDVARQPAENLAAQTESHLQSLLYINQISSNVWQERQ